MTADPRSVHPHSGYPDHGRDEKCGKCGAHLLSWCTEPDPCIGYLPGVFNACCGHGDDAEAYITFGLRGDGRSDTIKSPRHYGKDAIFVMNAIRTALGDLDDPAWHGGHDDPDATWEDLFGEK